MQSPERSPAESQSLVRQIVFYGAIGTLSASTDAAIFWVLSSQTNVPLQLANAIGIAVGITMSFWLNRAFTFRVSDKAMARFATFWAVGLTGLVLSAIILEVGLRAGFEPMRVKLVSVVIVAATQFVLNRTITFRQSRAAQ